MKTIRFPKNEWEEIRSRLNNNQTVYTIRVSEELGRYSKSDLLKTEWGEEVEIVSVRRIRGGLDKLKSEYRFFNELTEEMIDELKDYDEMEIISLKMKYLKGEEEEAAIRWMKEAAKIAKGALCLKAKCGTIIVNDGEVIGQGYNAPPLDKEENRFCDREIGIGKDKYDKTCCMHAEWRAIIDALKRNPDKIEGAKLYFTRVNQSGEIKKSGKPYCTVCSRMALDVGISEFVLWHEDGICEYPTKEYNELSYQYNPIKDGK